ncbi:MAG: hypothetical protein ACYC25_00425 [Paludibacter sp.]
MEKVVGQIVSKSSGLTYSVKWDSSEQTSWVSKNGFWQMVCTKVISSEGALECSQRFIDSQPDLF